MHVADRTLRLDECGGGLQMARADVASECSIGERRLEPVCDGLDVGTSGIAKLLGDIAAVGIAWRRSA